MFRWPLYSLLIRVLQIKKRLQYWQQTAKTVCKEILITRQELSDKNCIKESSDEKNKVMQIFFLLLKNFYREGVIKRKPWCSLWLRTWASLHACECAWLSVQERVCECGCVCASVGQKAKAINWRTLQLITSLQKMEQSLRWQEITFNRQKSWTSAAKTHLPKK